MSVKIKKKLVIVGDGSCGKTSLLMVQCGQQFPEHYVPTIFENHISNVKVDKKTVEMSLWDTAGQEDYDRLRPLSYPDTDVILIAFNVDCSDSVQNVWDKWYPETQHFCPGIPTILVATKTDLRGDREAEERVERLGQNFTSEDQGRRMATKIGAAAYFETSAKMRPDMVSKLFDEAARLALKGRKRKTRQSNCKII